MNSPAVWLGELNFGTIEIGLGVMSVEQRILNYRNYIDEVLKKEDMDWRRILEEHLTQIAFFQHERLVHLIVTVVFALLTMMALGLSCILFSLENPGAGMFLILTLACLVLLVPYIRHYYILENEVQKMYAQYDELMRRAEGDCSKHL